MIAAFEISRWSFMIYWFKLTEYKTEKRIRGSHYLEKRIRGSHALSPIYFKLDLGIYTKESLVRFYLSCILVW